MRVRTRQQRERGDCQSIYFHLHAPLVTHDDAGDRADAGRRADQSAERECLQRSRATLQTERGCQHDR
jgi:hypothetical protein